IRYFFIALLSHIIVTHTKINMNFCACFLTFCAECGTLMINADILQRIGNSGKPQLIDERG
ncbi:hypothetical protein, partial [Ruminococcus sp.]|uniref:hypothetical protein n=1 Tax=Ruminococcus sp. TaxID=41978 RepID=UPI003EFC117D